MRIGIDIRVLSTSRALSRYTKNITSQFLTQGRDHFFYLFSDTISNLAKIPAVASGLTGLHYEVIQTPKKMVIRDHFLFFDSLKKLNLDLFFHPDNTEFLRCLPRSVVTIHDLLPWKMPEQVLSREPLMQLRQKLYYSLQLRALKASCRKIIAVSENTKKDLVNILALPPEKIDVIYEGIEEAFQPCTDQALIEDTKKKYNISGAYLLYIGGFEPYKNVGRLLKAFGQTYSHNLKLVLAGKRGSGGDRLKKTAEELGMGETVLFPGFIEEEDLPKIYAGAVFLIYPSLYEGFGFPPLEAMACGTPAIISNSSSLPEAGGDTAIYFDPENINNMAGALQTSLKRYLSNRAEYEALSHHCLDRAQLFSWPVTGEKTLRLFESLVG